MYWHLNGGQSRMIILTDLQTLDFRFKTRNWQRCFHFFQSRTQRGKRETQKKEETQKQVTKNKGPSNSKSKA